MDSSHFGEDSVIYLCFGSSSMEMAPKDQLLHGVLLSLDLSLLD